MSTHGTECIVFLSGYLTRMPTMLPNYSTQFSINVSRKYISAKKNNSNVSNYRVIINQIDAIKILQYSHLGMCLFIQGELANSQTTEIIANKVDFIDFPSESSFNAKSANAASVVLH